MKFEIAKIVDSINKFVANASGDLADRNLSVSSVIGGVIGTQLTIPSSPVKNMRLYYQEQLYPITADYIGQINETFPIDVDVALECAYLLWVDRYKLVHSTRVDVTDLIYRLNCVTTLHKTNLDLSRISGLSRVLDENDAQLMNKVFMELITQLNSSAED